AISRAPTAPGCGKQPGGVCHRYTGAFLPATIEIRNATKKTKKRIFAIPADAPAMPPKPRIPAMIAMMKKVRAQLSIHDSSVKFGLDHRHCRSARHEAAH